MTNGEKAMRKDAQAVVDAPVEDLPVKAITFAVHIFDGLKRAMGPKELAAWGVLRAMITKESA